MTRWTIYLFFTAVLASTVVHGQTTGYINFAFRLFDNGSIVDSSTFFMPLSTRKWKIINDGSHISKIEHYDNKNKIFVASIGVLGSLPFTFSLCRDTINDRPNLDYSNKMTIIFKWDSCTNYIYCDSLTFKKDTFHLNNCCGINDTIDFFHIQFYKIKTIAQKQTASQPQTVAPIKWKYIVKKGVTKQAVSFYANGRKRNQIFYTKTGSEKKHIDWYPNGKKQSKVTYIRRGKYRKMISWDKNGKRTKLIQPVTRFRDF